VEKKSAELRKAGHRAVEGVGGWEQLRETVRDHSRLISEVVPNGEKKRAKIGGSGTILRLEPRLPGKSHSDLTSRERGWDIISIKKGGDCILVLARSCTVRKLLEREIQGSSRSTNTLAVLTGELPKMRKIERFVSS